MRSPWAREYARTPGRYIWGREPSSFALDVVPLLAAGARVLDLGCGEGRDSVFFATLGCDVTALDISRAGLHKAERLAAEQQVKVRWVHAEISRLPIDGPFDLVYSCGVIHYVPRRRRGRLYARLKALTRPGGHHALLVFTDRLIYVEKREVIDYFDPAELRQAYEDWLIVENAHGVIECDQDGTAHRHSVERLVARMPGHGLRPAA